MTDAAVQEGRDEAEDHSGESTPDELSELRDLLLAPEKTQLSDLQERIDNPVRYAHDVSRVLPNAITLSLNRDNKLANALMPTVQLAIAAAVRKNPQRLVDVIFPVMGPAIRKSIASAFSEMVQSLNQTLEYSLSLRGLKWRLEALRTGKSFAEVVLSHTLLYRVEQVFLIHRETGLLLHHVQAGTAAVHDADLVSGMLTAIQDFVHDSFSTERGDALESIEVGDLNVWIEPGSQAVLAAVIRGNAPIELRGIMQDSLDAVHVEQREALEAFKGDAAPFVASRPQLESCLQAQTERVTKKKLSPVLVGLPLLILLALGVWMFFSIRDTRRWNDYLSRLSAEPGLVVVSSEKRGGKYHLTGLRDPLAVDPTTMLQASKIDPQDVVSRWEPYQGSHPDLVLARAIRLLEPPNTVSLSVEGDALVARGYADHDWIKTTRKLVQMMPSVTRFADEGLIDLDMARTEIESVKQSLEQRSIQFALGSAEITPDQHGELIRSAAEIQRLESLSQSQGLPFRIEVWGHADQSGSQELNDRLIATRANQVMSALLAEGAKNLEIADAKVSGKTAEYTRSVTFKVKSNGSASANK
jgi:outer membrane protein OmpA-like peptidoglycan-associated protein